MGAERACWSASDGELQPLTRQRQDWRMKSIEEESISKATLFRSLQEGCAWWNNRGHFSGERDPPKSRAGVCAC